MLVLRRGGLAPPQAANLLLWGVCATVQALLRALQAMSEAPWTLDHVPDMGTCGDFQWNDGSGHPGFCIGNSKVNGLVGLP